MLIFKSKIQVRLFFICLALILCCTKPAASQEYLPVYKEVLETFFSQYTYTPLGTYALNFAKKKDGWHTEITDRLDGTLISSELFWSLKDKKYVTHLAFPEQEDPESGKQKVTDYLRNTNTDYIAYGYERCRYFGYNTWDADMIADFENKPLQNDTTMEGLARAFAFYAERFLWYGFGGFPFDNDPLKSPLQTLELPGKERIDKFILYTDKAIELYKKLAAKTPDYKMLVGNPRMKILNEQFHQYQQLITCGLKDDAKKILDGISGHDSIYSQIGHTYLRACPQNSILITYGDNDTYPLWYVQEKENFRTDVTVLNYSLISTPRYINRLKKDKWVAFSTNPGNFGKNIYYSYFLFREIDSSQITIPLAVSDFLQDIQNVKYPYYGMNDTVACYSTKKIFIDIDIPELKKSAPDSDFSPVMNIDLSSYIFLSDLIILDILNTNLYQRPVYLTVPSEFFSQQYMQREGPIFRILPFNNQDLRSKTLQEILKTEKYLKENYSPVLVSYDNHYEDVLNGLHSTLFTSLINNYLEVNDTAKANEWASFFLSHTRIEDIIPDAGYIELIAVLLKTKYKKEAMKLVENFSLRERKAYANYSALNFYGTPDDHLQILYYLKDNLTFYSLQSDILDQTIDYFKQNE